MTDPAPLQTLLSLIAKLPPNLRSDRDESGNYELLTSGSIGTWAWLEFKEYTAEHLIFIDAANGKRVGLLLDLAETAKAAEQQLQNIRDVLAELNQRNPVRGDRDAYLFYLVEWAQGERPDRPVPQSFNLSPL